MNSYEASTPTATNKPRVLIIPAAGRGVRFKELGRQYPKCILPVRGKPIIVHTLDLLTSEVEFADIIVPCADAISASQVKDALKSHGYEKVLVCVIADQKPVKPSPVLSLACAMELAVTRASDPSPTDVDVTVFLSDMIPASQAVAHEVANMETDTWGVVRKPDFNRWCMVSYDDESGIRFFDKPEHDPHTDRAAVGVYRYSSAVQFIDIAKQIVEAFGHEDEIQFSEVAQQYNKKVRKLYIHDFRDEDFEDFGTLEEYQSKRGLANKPRSFNEVELFPKQRIVSKSSCNAQKLIDEANWMRNLPLAMRRYAPTVLDVPLDPGVEDDGGFLMTQVRSTNLRDVALYIDRSYPTWVTIFNSVQEYIDTAISYSERPMVRNTDFWAMMLLKTANRLQGCEPSIKDWANSEFHWAIVQLTHGDYIMDPPCYYHGDLHFANMFYCFHYDDLTLIDPRGEQEGSYLYDIAKLAHSVYGRYDYIDGDLYSINPDGGAHLYDRGHVNIEKAFEDVIFNKLTKKEQKIVLTITASLFFSMVPLHQDNLEHCRLFVIEGKRIAEKAKAIDIG